MMVITCLLCAALAVYWVVPRPVPPERLEQVADTRSAANVAGRTRALPIVAGIAGAATLIIAGAVVDGARGGVLGFALAVIGGTAAGLARQHRCRRSALLARVEVARACALLAAQLRAGQVPSQALIVVAVDCPVLRQARDAQELGGNVARVWRSQAVRPGCGGLMDLARAWQVSTESGAPMAEVLEQVAEALAADQSLRAVVAGELSAPRATGKVMAALPGCGVGLGYLLGGEPVGWLLGGPLGWSCLAGGVVLACLGVLWIEALADRASAQEV